MRGTAACMSYNLPDFPVGYGTVDEFSVTAGVRMDPWTYGMDPKNCRIPSLALGSAPNPWQDP
jgi:hypothetical protein